MLASCRADHRCSSIACPTCTWRYALRVSRRVQAIQSRRLYALTIEFPISCPYEFRLWRKSFHNALAYQRRRYSWWRGVGIWAWHTGANTRGIVTLGAISTTEFMLALRRHGEVHLRPMSDEDVRVEVYRAARSIPAALADQRTGRYQSLKIAIAPRTTRKQPSAPITPDQFIEPLPMILL